MKIKKNAILNVFQEIRRHFWFILPIITLGVFIAIISIGYLYYTKNQELKEKEDTLKNLKQTYVDFQWKKDEIIAYSQIKKAYNNYVNSLLNFNLIFNTIEKYIPKESNRSEIKIKKVKDEVQVNVNAKIKWYQDYMSFLRVLDKCSFSDEKTKEAMLNIQKVDLATNKDWVEEIWNDINLNLSFVMNTTENPYLLLKKYEKKLKEFQDVGKFVYYINVSKYKNKYPDTVKSNYFSVLKEFYDRKKQFSKAVAQILKTDENGYYLVNSGENFINKIDTENKLISLLIDYYTWYKQELEKDLSQIHDNGDIIFKTKQGKEIIVFNLKDKINKLIAELNKKILKLETIKKYNLYLQDDNYLNTFTNLKKNSKKKYVLKIDWEEKEVSVKEYITSLIDSYDIVKEDEPLIEASIVKDKATEKNGKTEFTPLSDKDLEKEKKKIYNEMVTYVMNADKEKETLLNANTYLKSFYENDLKYRLYPEGVEVLNKFFSQALLNTDFLDNIRYPFFDFRVSPNINSYKRQFLLTIKNNKKLIRKIDKIKDLKSFIKELEDTEEFIIKTNDVFLARNNHINCLVKDIKQETKTIYKTVLEDKQNEDEKKNKIKEVDLIIDELWKIEKETNK